MKTYKSNIDESLNPTKSQLEKLHKEITSTLEKIGNREKYLNRELDTVLDNYRWIFNCSLFMSNFLCILQGRCKTSFPKLKKSIEASAPEWQKETGNWTTLTVGLRPSSSKWKNGAAPWPMEVSYLNEAILLGRNKNKSLNCSSIGQH